MIKKKIIFPNEKTNLHPRSKHRHHYDFKVLILALPELAEHVHLNMYNDESIDFSDAKSVMVLNKALLKYYYHIDKWQIPQGFLCPPIPGRADYIHYIGDLLAYSNNNKIPTGQNIKCLDIGVGANCIYPIIGVSEYGWSFVGSDVDEVAIHSASEIVSQNNTLQNKVVLRKQNNPNHIFQGMVQKEEFFDIVLCNPPFHSSFEEAQSGSLRKLSNLSNKKVTKLTLNFGGKSNELWCNGGEEKFIEMMISESKNYANSIMWFTTLISKESTLKKSLAVLKSSAAIEVQTIPMSQGSKISRILAWTYFNKEQRKNWAVKRW